MSGGIFLAVAKCQPVTPFSNDLDIMFVNGSSIHTATLRPNTSFRPTSLYWLVVEPYPSENMKVSWEYYSRHMEK